MPRVCLELNKIQIHRPKERWQLYFVLVADHPQEKDQMAVAVIPQRPILVSPEQHNLVFFEPQGKGSEGLLLLSREMPLSREINVHFHVMHSRRSSRDIGKVLENLETSIGKKALGVTTDLLGSSTPWLSMAKSAVPLVGQILSKIPDRNLGFISMFERFGPEFEREVEIDRENRGGHVTVVHSWSVQ